MKIKSTISTITLVVVLIFAFGAVFVFHTPFVLDGHAVPVTHQVCNCVVFRMDDVQDYWLVPEQKIAMDMFLSKNLSLTTAVIAGHTHKDPVIIKEVNAGVQRGLFELGIHGWQHINYSKLPLNIQTYTMQISNNRLEQLFAHRSNIFVPPFGPYNADTITAMEANHLSIITAEANDTNPSVIYNQHNNNQSQSIYHVPRTVPFGLLYNTVWFPNPTSNIMDQIQQSIKHYGYAVLVFHPQDFSIRDSNGTLTDNINQTRVHDLSNTINSVLADHIQVTSFKRLISG